MAELVVARYARPQTMFLVRKTVCLQLRFFATAMHLRPSITSNYLRGVAWQARARPALVLSVVGVIGLLMSIAALIVSRRLLGALSRDLPGDAMLLTALVATSVSACTRIAWRRSFPLRHCAESPLGRDAESPLGRDAESPLRRDAESPLRRDAGDSWLDQFVGWGSSLALAMLAVGCCYPANRTSDCLIWLPLLVADQFWRQNFFGAGLPTAPSMKSERQPTNTSEVSSTSAAQSPNHHDIVQQLFRVREDQGQEVIYGTLRADFQAGQRTAVIHVGFCPPLEYLPEIEAESLPGQPTRIKVVQALPHGVRLDVRLSTAAEESCQAWIDMAARPILPSKPQVITA